MYVVEDEASQIQVLRDSTSLTSTSFAISRTDSDKAYIFRLFVRIEDALGSIAYSDPLSERFLVPAQAPAVLLAKRDMVTTPVIVTNDPAFEQLVGTLWLEFETTADITTTQGLWSRDASGYGGGGHLSVWIQNGSIHARIQDTSTSYQLSWPVVRGTRNQAAIEFGEDTGFRLSVNGAIAASNPYTGGTVGNQRPIVVGALSWDWAAGRPDYTNPFLGTVRVSEFYAGKYDFSGRWGLPPITPPPPVDSMTIEVAKIDRGAVVDGETEYFSVYFAPIPNAAYIKTLIDGVEQNRRQAFLNLADPWFVSCSGACKDDLAWRGWEMYNADDSTRCSVSFADHSYRGWGTCVSQEEMIALNERNNDCVGGRYWAKHSTEIECNFNTRTGHNASFNYRLGTRPMLRIEVYNEQNQLLGYWERRAA